MAIRVTFRLPLILALAALGGCAHYTTPGRGVSIPEITEGDIAQELARKPAAVFPAHVILARVQGANYASYSNRGYGQGRYTLVTARDIELESDFTRLASLEGIAGIGTLSRVLLPPDVQSGRDLRQAAAQLHGDIVLLYTVDTVFRTDTRDLGPLQLVGLGFFRNKKASVTATCATAFLDVRTGYVYGVAEGTATETRSSDVWGTQAALDKARLKAERAAFEKAMKEVEAVWSSIYREYSRPAARADVARSQ
jgi:hypothetical protein